MKRTDIAWAVMSITLGLAVCSAAAQTPAPGKAIGVEGVGLGKTAEGGQRWALVIGINDYANVPALKYARQDAMAVHKALRQAGFSPKNMMLMTDRVDGRSPLYPTRGNLYARISQIAQSVGPNDALLIFFSGHGTEKNGNGYLVPVDGNTADLYSLISLSLIRKTLETSAAKHRLLILDACHSGAKAGDVSASSARALLAPLSGAAFATLSSCDVDQLSYEDDDRGLGVFTAAVVDGLTGAADRQAEGNGDGVVTAGELWAMASLRTRQWGMKSGKTQTPVLKGDFKGRIELARFRTPAELEAQREALQERLKKMQELQRQDVVRQLQKELAALEKELASITTSPDGPGGTLSDAGVQQVYTAFNAANKQVADLEALLAEKLKVYQPRSRAIGKIRSRLKAARGEVVRIEPLKFDADVARCRPLWSQIQAKQSAYDTLTQELLPSAPQAKKLAAEITAMQKSVQRDFDWEVRYYLQTGQRLELDKHLTLDCGDGVKMRLALIPPGPFMMGSPSNEKDRGSNEGPQHEVTISWPFYMGTYEVTQEQYQAVMGKNLSHFNLIEVGAGVAQPL